MPTLGLIIAAIALALSLPRHLDDHAAGARKLGLMEEPNALLVA